MPLKSFAPLALLPALLCGGCVLYCALNPDSEEPLTDPDQIPPPPILSAEYAAYRNCAVACGAKRFAETTRAYDMGYAGVPACVGVYPLKAVAARSTESLVANHFRVPLPGESPAAEIDITPSFISVRRNGNTALVKIKIDVACTRQDGTGRELFRESYTGERTGEWVRGRIPVALYEAFNDIMRAFLEDFRRKVPPDALSD